MELRDVIDRQAWEEARPLIYDIKKMKHNRGLLIDCSTDRAVSNEQARAAAGTSLLVFFQIQ